MEARRYKKCPYEVTLRESFVSALDVQLGDHELASGD
jgi:hypothetical protein